MPDRNATPHRVPTFGSRKVGPSRLYLKMLRGEVTSEHYIAVLRRWARMVAT